MVKQQLHYNDAIKTKELRYFGTGLWSNSKPDHTLTIITVRIIIVLMNITSIIYDCSHLLRYTQMLHSRQ
jgi:hypothetical protein